MYAYVQALTRVLHSVPVNVIIFYSSLMEAPSYIGMAILDRKVSPNPGIGFFGYDAGQWFWMIFVSILVLLSGISMILGGQNASPAFVTTLTYIGVVYGLTFDYFLFD